MEGIIHWYEIVHSKVIAVNTIEYVTKDGVRRVRYHDTDVVSFFPEKHGGRIYLNSNGFNTVTTRSRINAALQKAGIHKAHMFQRNNLVWFMDTTGKVVEFDNRLVLDKTGKIVRG